MFAGTGLLAWWFWIATAPASGATAAKTLEQPIEVVPASQVSATVPDADDQIAAAVAVAVPATPDDAMVSVVSEVVEPVAAEAESVAAPVVAPALGVAATTVGQVTAVREAVQDRSETLLPVPVQAPLDPRDAVAPLGIEGPPGTLTAEAAATLSTETPTSQRRVDREHAVVAAELAGGSDSRDGATSPGSAAASPIPRPIPLSSGVSPDEADPGPLLWGVVAVSGATAASTTRLDAGAWQPLAADGNRPPFSPD